MPVICHVVCWSLLVFAVVFSAEFSKFCPVTSPMNEKVYITNIANQTMMGMTLTQCTMSCMVFAALNAMANVACRYFNYNSTSMNCSLFNYEPSTYGVDQSGNTIAYQDARTNITTRDQAGLWTTVPISKCIFPFQFNGQMYYECRHVTRSDPYCFLDFYSCILPDSCPAFCIPGNDALQGVSTYAVSLWVDRVISFSSQYDSNSWSANQVIGAPNVYPRYGDITGTWAPNRGSTIEFIVVEFANSTLISSIELFETNIPGAVVRISSLNWTSNSWVTLWTAVNMQPQVLTNSRIFAPNIKSATYETNRVKLELNTPHSDWYELDAIRVNGTVRANW